MAGCSINELDRHPHLITGLANRAFDDVFRAEFGRDLLHVDGAALVNKGRVARDDGEHAPVRQSGDDILSQSIDEIILLAVARHVDEWEDRDGRPPPHGFGFGHGGGRAVELLADADAERAHLSSDVFY
jgi:hypothetical protein